MSELTHQLVSAEDDEEIPLPDVSNLVTEDDTPVDNLISERGMHLLKDSGYSSWRPLGVGRRFVMMANVALYATTTTPPLVPDVLLSLDVDLPEDGWLKQNRSYLIWQYGKPPELVVEIVSNRKGEELGNKLLDYARLGVAYYVVFDPQRLLGDAQLRIFGRVGSHFIELAETWFEDIGIGVTLWHGRFQGLSGTWLRWCDRDGNILLTGEELAKQERERAEQERDRAEQEHQRAEQERDRAEQEHQRAEQERDRAEQERQRAEDERERAERLAAQLRALGIDPEP